MAGNALNIYADLHASPLAAIDTAVGRLSGNDEFRTNLVLIDDVLPAKAVAVLLLNGTRYKNRVLIREKAQIFHDLCAVYCGDDSSALIGNAAAADLGLSFIALVWIEGPVAAVADSYGIDVGVKANDGFACAHKAKHVAHGIDLYLIKAKISHFLRDALDMGLLITAFAGILYDFA